MSNLAYLKKPLKLTEQVELLQHRGLFIENPPQAILYLNTIGYYRLSAYFKPFELNKITHQFKQGSTFQSIIHLYQFDCRLRLTVMEAIEKIEIALCAGMAQELTVRHGAWWYLNPSLFKAAWTKPLPQGRLSPEKALLNELQLLANKKKEASIKHYYQKYQTPSYPPSWMILDCLSFGQCINLFHYLADPNDQCIVSFYFNLKPIILDSALKCIRVMRNSCAHHARVWDKSHLYVPRKLKELQQAECLKGSTKEQLMLLQILVKAITREDNWRTELFHLFNEFSAVPFINMGFKANWREDKFWVT